MLANYRIQAPFFEFGPKAYLYGEPLLDLVMAIDRCAIEYDVDVIVDPQPTDIPLLAQHVKRVVEDFRAVAVNRRDARATVTCQDHPG